MHIKRLAVMLISAAPLVFADRLVKSWAQNALQSEHGGVMSAWEGVFRFRYARNTGVAFSALSGSSFTVILIFTIIAVLIIYALGSKRSGKWIFAGLALIIAGGAGNLYDRLTLGYVVDFIELTFIRFAIFNMADIFICVGGAISIIASIIADKRGKKA